MNRSVAAQEDRSQSPQPTVPAGIADSVLLAGIAQRQQQAMEQIYDRYSPMVMALGLRMLKERGLAEELLNDVFMELWTRVDRFDAQRGTLITYLLTMCRSRAIDRLRAQRRHAAVPLPDEGLSDPERDQNQSPFQSVVNQETGAQVGQGLARLTPEQRQAIELAYFEDLSHSQIAKCLDRPLGTVKTHIRQGLIQLHETLRKDLVDGEAEAGRVGRKP